MASMRSDAAGHQETAAIPRKTIQDVLSVLWWIQLRAERGDIRGTYTLEAPIETVLLVGDLIKEIGAVVCGADDAPVSSSSSQIMGKPWSLT